MIHDLADLELLLRQYDPEKVLVGPLLDLWANSNFRVFNIAGNGPKIHETVGLGFVKVETDAERRRADIVALLKNRFGEVQIFDSQLEMARMAYTLWANDETSRFLATATIESERQPTTKIDQDQRLDDGSKFGAATATVESERQPTTKVDQDQSLDDGSKFGALPDDRGEEFVDEVARGSVGPDAASAPAPLSARGPAQPTPACELAQAHESSTHTIANTETGAETDANTETVARLQTGGANTLPIALDQLQTRGARSRSAAGRRHLFWTAAAATAFAVSVIVLTSTRQIANEVTLYPTAGQLITAAGDNPSQTTGTVVAAGSDEARSKPAEAARSQQGAPAALAPPSPPPQVLSAPASATPDELISQSTKMPRDRGDATSDLGPQARPSQTPGAQASTAPVPAASEGVRSLLSTAPPSEPKLPPSSAESTQIVVGQDRPQQRSASEVASPKAVDVSAIGELQRPPLQERSTARQLRPEEIAAFVSRGSNFLKTGDFSAARILLQRGAEAGSADAALMLGKTFDPLFLHEIGAVGIKPDLAQCRRWYRKAVELGSEAAAQRLANLGQTGR